MNSASGPLAVVDEGDLPGDGEVVGFGYVDGLGRAQRGLLVRWEGRLHAFRNLCPHWSTPLDEYGGEILDPAIGELVCQTHGARFELDSGNCVSGPCVGDSLQKLRVELGEGEVKIYRPGLTF